MACTNTGLLQRKRQVLGKLEENCGTFETPDAIDGKLRVQVAPSITPDVTLNERGIASASLSQFKDIIGELTATATFSSELAGSGSVSTEPECSAYLQACGMEKLTLSSASIGAVTSGPFIAGEIVDDGSGNEAIVLPAEDGDSTIYFAVTTGTIEDADTLTGQTSGASATLSSAPAAAGFLYRPTSSVFNAISLQHEEDGYVKKLKGCMGTFTISAESSMKGMIEFEFNGSIESFGDGAFTSGITYNDTVPPILQSAEVAFDDGTAGEYSPVLTSVSLDIGNEVVLRKDANNPTGIKAAMITARAPSASFDPEMTLATNYDFFDKYFNGTPISLQFKLPGTAGNTIEVYAARGQIAGAGDGERDGITTLDLSMNLKRIVGDDECIIVFK